MRFLLAAACLGLATSLYAQSADDASWRRASFTTGASFGAGGTALALSAALGFEFPGRAGLEFEIVYARKLDFTIDLCPPPRVCVLGGQLPVTGRTVSLLPQLTIDLLPASRRWRLYLQAGAGAGHVRQRYWFPARDPGAVELTRSNLAVAMGYGGGAGLRISRRLAIGADLRWLHVFDERAGPDHGFTPSGTLTTVRVGSRVSWRF